MVYKRRCADRNNAILSFLIKPLYVQSSQLDASMKIMKNLFYTDKRFGEQEFLWARAMILVMPIYQSINLSLSPKPDYNV